MIFTDEETAARFRADLLRFIEAGSRTSSGPFDADRWAAYREECERTIGRALTAELFGPLASMIPGISQGLGSAPNDDESTEDVESLAANIRPSERVVWARWIGRLITTTEHDADRSSTPLAYQALIVRIVIQLLAQGVWDPDDESWREILTRLAVNLVPQPADHDPGPVHQLVAALAAVCMGLLQRGVSMTGGTTEGVLAARAWRKLRPLVADADPDLVADLLISPVHAQAVTLNLSELEDIIYLAMDDDPAALLISELAERGWELSYDGLMYRVTGSFTNPLNVAARVATRLGASLGAVLVHARARDRWAFMAWHRPGLLLASEPGHAWRIYRIDGAVTPESRFAGGEGIPAAGMVGRPVPFGKGLPPGAVELLGATGTDPAEVLARVISMGVVSQE